MQPTRSILALACLLFLLIGLGRAQQQEDPREDDAPTRRPATGRRPRQRQGANNNPGASVSGSAALAVPSPGLASRPSVEGSADFDLRPTAGSPNTPMSAPSGAGNLKPTSPPEDEEDLMDDGVDPAPSQRPMRRPSDRKRRPPKKPRRPIVVDEEEEPRYPVKETESCEDDDYQHGEYGHLFGSMAGGPMRHFGRLMKSALNRGMSMGSAATVGDNMASASAYSSPGLTRMSSSVSNNGRTRGIVSETRNGRTRTRTFGGESAGDNEEADEEDDDVDY